MVLHCELCRWQCLVTKSKVGNNLERITLVQLIVRTYLEKIPNQVTKLSLNCLNNFSFVCHLVLISTNAAGYPPFYLRKHKSILLKVSSQSGWASAQLVKPPFLPVSWQAKGNSQLLNPEAMVPQTLRHFSPLFTETDLGENYILPEGSNRQWSVNRRAVITL